MHGLDSNLVCLRRWAAISEQPMPQSWDGFKQKNNTLAMEIEAKDPELVSLLNCTAGAGLRADAISGSLSPVAPTIEDRQKEAIKKEGTELFNQGAALNFSGQMRLMQVAPAAYEQWKTHYGSGQNEGVDEQNARQKQAQLNELRLASRNL